ncbi:MAG: VOC family protein [Candidatus Dojkabacteria bacterium]
MIPSNHNRFIAKVYKLLAGLGIDTDKLSIDHTAYQADSAEDYESQKKHVMESEELISENIVGGRRVGIFGLKSPLSYKGESFSVIEIIEPRAGQEVKSAWEHVEFMVEGTLEEFMAKHPKLQWTKDAIDRNEFPMLILKLTEDIRAKFPRRSVLDEIERQKQNHSSLRVQIGKRSVEIDYTSPEGIHILGISDRPFEAIVNDTKRVEYRTNTLHSPFDYSRIRKGDGVRFINEQTGETLERKVSRISHYNTTRELYENEGLNNSSSKPRTVDEAISRLESLTGYKEGIAKNGVFAIAIY